ncbi:transcriptional regulator [Mycobacterium sp. 852014-52450_SCH5900713]|uniref:PucR family transcriptional regulator n=1 Tax=Mycobacterium sp. 852014-52450_SCH5900713 TaxID=1834116 RepID=UPI000801F348|nr:helix-turn-helix domain-containing protein [Mycobacterium sp. 852014-52450_SCH5900713]OBF90261.1 transcriptional regulator [Mycobacterium sp. 852014-52450_SCH5900713]
MAGVGLGQLLLALDATLVRLVEAPRGLDLPVGSAALIDSDDVRLGLAAAASSADVFFLLGVADDEALRWMDKQARERVPVAIFAKQPSTALVSAAVGNGSAMVAVEPRARWERLYQLVNHVLEHHGDRADATEDSGTDLFGLAQSLAHRIHGMVSIENAQSHVLAYSASNDEADELRRLSILGRAGPPEHLEWIGQWGIFDALRASDGVVRVAERPELGLRPRLAVGIYQEADARRPPAFAGTIWVQQGTRPLAADAEEMLRGAAVLAGRIMARLAARPSTHARRVQQLLGLIEGEPDVAAVARELGLAADGDAALIGWDASDTAGAARPARLADVMALSASAFRRDAQLASRGSRIYVLLPKTQTRSVTSWVRGTIAAMRSELGVQLRAAIAAPVAGLAGIAAARAEVDRVLDSAARHPISIPQVTSLAEARTTVLLDEILALVGREERSVDPRIVYLRAREPVLAETLRVYLDSFGDVAAAAQSLHVHPNTVRYRIRRIEKLLTTSLADPEVRLLFSLSLRLPGGP